MKTIIKFLPLVLIVLASCKKEGCRDPYALNYDSSAGKDGTCKYTTAIFYASTNEVPQREGKVEKIEVQWLYGTENITIGTIENLEDQNPVPQNCIATNNSLTYTYLNGDTPITFNTWIYWEDGYKEAGDSYTLTPGPDKECILQDLTQ